MGNININTDHGAEGRRGPCVRGGGLVSAAADTRPPLPSPSCPPPQLAGTPGSADGVSRWEEKLRTERRAQWMSSLSGPGWTRRGNCHTLA